MKTRMLALLLALTLLLPALPMAAFAQVGYGDAPIYLGYPEVDYMAEEILKEIDLTGKTDREKIAAVYDWIQKNCRRTGAADQTYFDPETVQAQADGPFLEQMSQGLAQGAFTLRIDLAAEMTEADPVLGTWLVPYDSNWYIASFSSQMMLYRVGTCAHFAALLTVLLGHLGYDCRLIDGVFLNSDGTQVEHKWNMVLLDGKYLWLDPRMDQANYQRTGQVSRTYFLVESTEEWAKKHSWDRAYSDGLMACAADVANNYTLLLQAGGRMEEILSGAQPWLKCSGWAEPSVKKAAEQGIYPQELTLADLTKPVTRGEFAAVAVLFYQALSGKEAQTFTGDSLPFSDVSGEETVILSAYQMGIVQGVGNGTFQPQSTLSREAAVTMLGRVCELALLGEIGGGTGLPRGETALPDFSDAAATGSWARPYVDYFVSQGVVNGINGAFAPKQDMSREQALKVAAEALDRLTAE